MITNVSALRTGDYVLVAAGKRRSGCRLRRAEVIYTNKTGVIGVQFSSDHKVRYFDSRKGYQALVAGARLVEGKWQPL